MRCALFFLFSAAVVSAAVPPLQIPHVSRAPKLADFLENTPREAETVVTDFRQFDPGDGVPVSQPTAAYLSYDDRNLYVAFVCHDDPALIRARVAKRKDIQTDDRVTINIDTFGDRKRAYFFDVNPYGVQLDGITTDGIGDDFTFETLWYTESKITEDGYVVLETIPFRSLRFPVAERQKWNIALARFIQRNNELACWPHISRTRLPQFVGQFGPMEGMEGISSGRNLQFTPYMLFSKSRYFVTPDNGVPGYYNDHEFRPGLDAKTVIKDSLTLDFTLNPDFSQVESDEPQVTVNQRYAVYFPERRPFFTENAGLFQMPEELFFSRNIVDPQFGMRLTGKVGRWAIAALAADDRAPGPPTTNSDLSFTGRAETGVLRVQREFGTQSHIGGMVTDREVVGGWNRVASLDTRLVFPNNWTFAGQLTGSNTRDLGTTAFDGQALRVSVGRSTRHFSYQTRYVDRSPTFRADLGYIERVDIRELRHEVSYRWRPERSRLVSYGPGLAFSTNWDRQGRLQDWSVEPRFELELPRLTWLELEHSELFERYDNIGFRKRNTHTSVSTEWFKWLAMGTHWNLGTGVNYYPAAGLVPFTGRSQSGHFELTLRPQPKLRFDQSYFFTRLSGDETVFNDHVLRSKANYQFSRALSLRAIFDYHGVLPNKSLADMDDDKRIGADVLLTYLLHPGTAFYVGYTSSYENFLFDPALSPAYQRTATPGALYGRQIYAKLSYTLRY